jgi:hypothetical protein
MKAVIKSCQLNEDEPLENVTQTGCKTFIVATIIRAAGSPVLMRTYNNLPSTEAFEATIWQAARATSAAPTFFKPITINDVRYADGGTGYNNPTQLAIDEAYAIWENRPIGCLISIGTGLEDAIQLDQDVKGLIKSGVKMILGKTAFKISVATWCVELLTSSEVAHRQVLRKVDMLKIESHFRFNVPQSMSKIGLNEWKKIEDMSALTRDYMRSDPKLIDLVGRILLNPSISIAS